MYIKHHYFVQLSKVKSVIGKLINLHNITSHRSNHSKSTASKSKHKQTNTSVTKLTKIQTKYVTKRKSRTR